MNNPKKIAVIIPAVNDILSIELLRGIYLQAKTLGYDVIVLTNFSKSQYNETDYIKYFIGEENIYNLIEQIELDGIIFAANKFLKSSLIKRIINKIKTLNIPSVYIGLQIDGLNCVSGEQKLYFKNIVSHLINKHNCKKIYCLTGPKGNYDSEQRIQGFYEALEENGIPYNESHIFYGDFWKSKATTLAKKIAKGEIEKPDAIACANDIMAISLCETLINNGIRVPEDIAVTGFDGTIHATINEPSITTLSGAEQISGIKSVIKIHEIITSKKCSSKAFFDFSIEEGQSCGCRTKNASYQSKSFLRNKELFIRENMYQEIYKTSNFMGKLSDKDSIESLISTVDEHAYMLHKWETINMCLCTDWLGNMDMQNEYRTKGYSDNMKLMLHKTIENNIQNGLEFNTKILIPYLNKPHSPKMCITIPLHHNDRVQGYIVLTYSEASYNCFDGHFFHWCDTICNAIEFLRVRKYITHVKNQMDLFSERDALTGFYNRKGLIKQIKNTFSSLNLNMFIFAISYEFNKEINNTDTEYLTLLISNSINITCKAGETPSRINSKTFIINGYISEFENLEDIEYRISTEINKNIGILNQKQYKINLNSLHFINLIKKIEKSDLNNLDDFLNSILDKLRLLLNNPKNENSEYEYKMNLIRKKIHMEPEYPWNIGDIASSLGLSRSHFQRIYKNEFSISCINDVIQSRITMAKKLLSNTNLNIDEIAAKCGYQNSSHFMKQFKQMTGLTASQYRKNN